MHFPRFWKKEVDGGVIAWGWSDSGPDDAMENAKRRAQRIREWLARGERKPSVDTLYGYPDRPMREEVMREFQDAAGSPVAVLSHNTAGCLVLNTINLMFVDVDEPYVKPDGFLARLFGRKKDKAPEPPFDEKILSLAGQWLRERPDWGWRIYRTKAGMRMIATHAPVRQDDPIVGSVFSTFDADRLYRDLCEKQQCFRARLTPKAWRCDLPDPPARWPWEDAGAEAKYRAWEQRYAEVAKDYATCRLLGQFGAAEIHPALRGLVEFHDETTRAASGMPLA